MFSGEPHVPSIDVIFGVSRNVRVFALFDNLPFFPIFSAFCMLDRFIRPSVEEIKLVSLLLGSLVIVSDVL